MSGNGCEPNRLGWAGGTLLGFLFLSLSWIGGAIGYGEIVHAFLATLYPGYTLSFLGGCVGFFYGWLTGFSLSYLFGRLYDFFDR